MMSPKVTSPEEEEGANADRAEREGGVAESDYRDQKWAFLCLTVV